MDIAPSLLSLAGVVAGWFLVHRLAVQRERSAEWRHLAHTIADEVEAIERLALEYHKKANRDIELEEDILKRLDRAEVKVHILSQSLVSVDTSCLIRFRQAITLKNFLTTNHVSQCAKTGLYKGIIASANNVLEQLYCAQ